ncbi:MAG: LLM class flavin-dependent oxidoreductase [Alphaproteobacteria bacterium]|nr:LLM class flavin-dependent oxidoreductase [Alphaproteobacteria bacterium]
MRFNLVINMERLEPDHDMGEVARHTTEMVQMADDGGFDIAWAAEHHAIEMTIAPGPFQLLAHLAAHTSRIRLGTAVVVAPYWHPIKLAGEAAMFDLLSGGRLEFGIGKGAYQREFDRLAGGMNQNQGVPMMLEMIPALKALWAGDYEHDGEYWQFPAATSVPKPVQKPHPPIWVAARDPGTFDAAVKDGYSVMTWALTRPFSEVETYMERFESALAKSPGVARPRFMTMRHAAIYGNADESDVYIEALQHQGRQFENLFRNLAPVVDGFPQEVPFEMLQNQGEYEREKLLENLIFGTPDQAIATLKRYEALGVDYFCYCASYGLPLAEQKKSLRLFIDEVMPAFQERQAAAE